MTEAEMIKRIAQLEAGLKQLKLIFESEVDIIVSFNGDRENPHRDLRLYTNKGKALGFGKAKLNVAPSKGSQDDLFQPISYSDTYSAKIIVKELFSGKK